MTFIFVALGILAILAVIFVLFRFTPPSASYLKTKALADEKHGEVIWLRGEGYFVLTQDGHIFRG